MDLWQRARDFAEEAAKRSQDISKEAAKRSQEFTRDAVRLSQEFVSETAKKSKDLASEATKKADVLKIEAFKRAEQIKTLAGEIPLPIGSLVAPEVAPEPQTDLEVFGVTDELREYVKGFTLSSFRDFQIQDELEKPESPTVLNVRQDLNEWQARHAALILSTAKEISKLRYELCPRYMKERKFWRIYFILVKSYVAVYERQYMEELSAKASAQTSDERLKVNPSAEPASKSDVKQTKLDNKASSSKAEDDLDVFLLGDLGSDDDADPGISVVDDDGLGDDFDKIGNSGLVSDEDDEQKSAQSNKAGGT